MRRQGIMTIPAPSNSAVAVALGFVVFAGCLTLDEELECRRSNLGYVGLQIDVASTHDSGMTIGFGCHARLQEIEDYRFSLTLPGFATILLSPAVDDLSPTLGGSVSYRVTSENGSTPQVAPGGFAGNVSAWRLVFVDWMDDEDPQPRSPRKAEVPGLEIAWDGSDEDATADSLPRAEYGVTLTWLARPHQMRSFNCMLVDSPLALEPLCELRSPSP